MITNDFDVHLTRRGDEAVLVLTGTVTRSAKEDLESAYRQVGPVDKRVLLDFSQVEYINSTGIAVIVGLLAMARGDEKQVGAFGLSDHYREVFQITRLADFMTLYDDEAAAAAGS